METVVDIILMYLMIAITYPISLILYIKLIEKD